MPLLRPTGVLLVLAALVAVPQRAGADLPFASGFEIGRLCEWADGDGVCSTEEEMAAGLLGTFPVCVPPSTSTIPGGSMTVCGTTTCSTGAAGCDATAHVTSATFTLASGTATFLATIDDDVFPTQVTLGSTYNCNLNVTQGTGTGSFVFTTVPACFVPLLEVATVDLAAIDLNATLAFSGCAVASILNSFMGTIQPAVLAQAEQQVGPVLQDGARRAWLGRWVCPGP